MIKVSKFLHIFFSSKNESIRPKHDCNSGHCTISCFFSFNVEKVYLSPQEFSRNFLLFLSFFRVSQEPGLLIPLNQWDPFNHRCCCHVMAWIQIMSCCERRNQVKEAAGVRGTNPYIQNVENRVSEGNHSFLSILGHIVRKKLRGSHINIYRTVFVSICSRSDTVFVFYPSSLLSL